MERTGQVEGGGCQHVIICVDNLIFDSNQKHTMPVNKQSLDWCCSVDDGSKVAQMFVGTKSCVIDVHNVVSTFQDVICTLGALTKLISDSAQVEIGNKIKDILCHLHIDDCQSEAHHHHQD